MDGLAVKRAEAMPHYPARPAPHAVPPRAEVLAFVRAFYDVARVDPEIGPVFGRIVADGQWEHHFETMTDFWSAVGFGGPSFRGDPMTKHARIRDLSQAHFDRWLSIFEKTARAYWEETTADRLVLRAHQIAPALLEGAARARSRGQFNAAELR